MNWPTDRLGGGARIAVRLGLWLSLAVTATGCRQCGDDPKPPPRSEIELRVDDPDLDYVYRTPEGRLRTATAVSAIPPTLRGAVMVYHPTMTGADRDGDRVFVADLLGANPGDTIRARATTREAYARRTATLRDARHTAKLIRLAALELTQLNPESHRRAATDEARETFNDILPRLRDPDASGQPPPDAGDAPDGTADTRDSSPRTAP